MLTSAVGSVGAAQLIQNMCAARVFARLILFLFSFKFLYKKISAWTTLQILLKGSLLLNRHFFFTACIFIFHSRKSLCVNYEINGGWMPFSCFSFRFFVLVLAHCHGLLGTVNVITIITPVLYLLWQGKKKTPLHYFSGQLRRKIVN